MGIFHGKSRPQNDSAESIKIVLIGLENAGKTSFMRLLTAGDSRGETIPTIGFNIGECRLDTGKGLIFDVGGQSKAMWRNYITDAKIVIFIVDSADKSRIDELRSQIRVLSSNIDKKSLLIFLLNKIDLGDSVSIQQFIADMEIDRLFNNDLFIHRISVVKRLGFEQFLSKMSTFLKTPKISL